MVSAQDDPQKVFLSSWGWSQQGDHYDENQDSYLNWPERKFWSIADGVGGSDHGAAASKFVMKAFMGLKASESLADFSSEVRAMLFDSNRFLYNQGQLGGSAASTVVCLLMHEGHAVCLWAGDSRCYLLREGVLYQCTKDHTLRQHKIDSGELTVHEAHRMVKGNIITNAVGGKAEMTLGEETFVMRAGDRFLLCSDGLYNLLSSEALTQYMQRKSPQACCEAMAQAMDERRMMDNVTFIVVFLTRG